MSEEPVPDDDAREHPIDAAARGAHRGPPVPGPASPRLTWGARATLLLPAYLLASVGYEIVARAEVSRLALVAPSAALVAVLVLVLGWAVGRPRLTDIQATQLYSELGPEGMRRLRRALRRGREPIPAELRPWIEPYLATFYSSGPLFGLLGAAFGGSSAVASASRPEVSTGQVAVVVLIGVGAAAGICLLASPEVLRRRARRLGSLPESPASTP